MREEENARLKGVVTALTLDRHILQEVLRIRLKPVRRRELAHWIRDQLGSSVQLGASCRGRLLDADASRRALRL